MAPVSTVRRIVVFIILYLVSESAAQEHQRLFALLPRQRPSRDFAATPSSVRTAPVTGADQGVSPVFDS